METNQNDLEETDKILNASSASSRDIDDISRDTDKASIELYANIVNLSDNKILFEFYYTRIIICITSIFVRIC